MSRSGGGDAADRVDALLPQTQCTRCGYPSCRAYAEALSAGDTDLNRCPPGGEATIEALARTLGRAPRSLDPACGAGAVDAILGAGRRMHTVIGSECTGCELCLEPCPVDCISLVPMPLPGAEEDFLGRWMRDRAPLARRRFEARGQRSGRRRRRRAVMPGRDADRATKRAVIEAAVERARQRRRVIRE